MDNVEDSGIDSDQKMSANDRLSDDQITDVVESESLHGNQQSRNYTHQTASELQKKIEKQRNAYKNSYKASTQKPLSKHTRILPRSRLKVPLKHEPLDFSPLSQDDHLPLIQIITDSSEEDEFETPFLKKAQHSIHQQLIKDGYNLDKTPDDEDLDLIPPRPLHERHACCQIHSSCHIL